MICRKVAPTNWGGSFYQVNQVQTQLVIHTSGWPFVLFCCVLGWATHKGVGFCPFLLFDPTNPTELWVGIRSCAFWCVRFGMGQWWAMDPGSWPNCEPDWAIKWYIKCQYTKGFVSMLLIRWIHCDGNRFQSGQKGSTNSKIAQPMNFYLLFSSIIWEEL